MIVLQLNKSVVSGAATILDRSYVLDLLKAEPYIGNLWHLFIVFAIMLITVKTIVSITNKYKVKNKGIYFLLYFYHMAIGGVYFYLTKNNLILADARTYYNKIIAPDIISAFAVEFVPSTNFIVWLTDKMVNVFGFNYLCCTFLFATLGFYGILFFLRILFELGGTKSLTYLGVLLLPTLFFLPNIHFWTVALGKDSFIFYAIMGFTFSLVNFRKRWYLTLMFGFLFFMIRPHIFIFALMSVFLTLLFYKRINYFIKIFAVTLFSVLGFFFLDFILKTKFNISNFDLNLVINLIDKQQGYYVDKGYSQSSVDITNYPIPFQMFSYLYRPLFEKFTPNFLLISFENLFLLMLSIQLFSRRFIRYFRKAPFVVKFCFIYAIIGVGFMGYINSNFGVSTRQKTMFLYSLLLVILAFIINKKAERKSNSDSIPKVVSV